MIQRCRAKKKLRRKKRRMMNKPWKKRNRRKKRQRERMKNWRKNSSESELKTRICWMTWGRSKLKKSKKRKNRTDERRRTKGGGWTMRLNARDVRPRNGIVMQSVSDNNTMRTWRGNVTTWTTRWTMSTTTATSIASTGRTSTPTRISTEETTFMVTIWTMATTWTTPSSRQARYKSLTQTCTQHPLTSIRVPTNSSHISMPVPISMGLPSRDQWASVLVVSAAAAWFDSHVNTHNIRIISPYRIRTWTTLTTCKFRLIQRAASQAADHWQFGSRQKLSSNALRWEQLYDCLLQYHRGGLRTRCCYSENEEYRAGWSEDSHANLGHSRSGSLPHNYIKLLQGCSWNHAGLRRYR